MNTARTRNPPPNLLVIAFFTIFLDLLGFGIIIPIQPFYAEAFGASPAWVTLLGGSYSAMQFLFAPFWGRLSDRVGRRPIILSSVAISCVGYLLFGLSGSLGMLFVSRMLSGFGNANLGTAQAIISDCTTAENRAKGMGMIGAAFGLGFILGPALGGLLGQFDRSWPAFAAAALGLINWILAYWMLPETLRPGSQSPHQHLLSVRALREAMARPHVGEVFAITLISAFAFSMMEQIIGLFIEKIWTPEGMAASEAMSLAARRNAYVMILVGITATVVQGGLIGRLTRRYGEVLLSRAGLLLLAFSLAGMAAAGFYGTWTGLLVATVGLATGSGLNNPSLNSLVSRYVDPQEQGAALGTNQSLSALGRVIGPALAGLLFQWKPGAPFLTGAAVMLVAFGFSLRLVRPALPLV